MYSLISKALIVGGAYIIILVLIYLTNQSALYSENDEFLYVALVFVFIIVLILSMIIKVIGSFKNEQHGKLFTAKRKVFFLCLIVSIPLFLAPTIYNRYLLFNYGITTSWHSTSGSDNFNVLLMDGVLFCEIDDNKSVNFKDVNSDGYADIVINGNLKDVLFYNPSQKTFIGCPDYGG